MKVSHLHCLTNDAKNVRCGASGRACTSFCMKICIVERLIFLESYSVQSSSFRPAPQSWGRDCWRSRPRPSLLLTARRPSRSSCLSWANARTRFTANKSLVKSASTTQAARLYSRSRYVIANIWKCFTIVVDKVNVPTKLDVNYIAEPDLTEPLLFEW